MSGKDCKGKCGNNCGDEMYKDNCKCGSKGIDVYDTPAYLPPESPVVLEDVISSSIKAFVEWLEEEGHAIPEDLLERFLSLNGLV